MAEAGQIGHARATPALPRPVAREPLGAILHRRAGVSGASLRAALDRQREGSARIGEILCADGLIDADALADALAFQHGLEWVDLTARAADPAAAQGFDPLDCLKHGFVPVWRHGGALTVATSRPERLADIAAALPQNCGPVRLVYATEAAVRDAVAGLWCGCLTKRAESRCPAPMSCRGVAGRGRRLVALAGLPAAAAILAASPVLLGGALLALALAALIANTVLKLVAVLARPQNDGSGDRATDAPLPRISLLVPLLHEAAVLPALIGHLKALDYPHALLDTWVIVEADDATTRAAIDAIDIPDRLRVLVVPSGTVKTKPRALNYALDFARGEIVGIYDAEDAPEPDQLRRVAAEFARGGPRLACVQGILDFYNDDQNLLTRCFAIEYAVWFRVLLSGLAARGLPFPLGGTTMFVRREALEAVGAWDAHNVTEDADLGIRLARLGYRCSHVSSVTYEEATSRPIAWIRQRGRWLKGFAITWATHMRAPLRLWRELGPAGFLTVQALFLGALGGFLLAPALWTFWLTPVFGMVVLAPWLPAPLHLPLFAGFLLVEAVGIAIGLIALRRRGSAWLALWIPALHLYYPLGTLAAWRALGEAMTRPFYWAKTQHGLAPARPRGARSAAGFGPFRRRGCELNPPS
jgi:cellulose synthase/poly-beta-1,6-N-acetylglucosamine synthase-like glycosyltransferase